MRVTSSLAALLTFVLAATTATASPVPFDRAWKEQGFLRLWTNDYSFRGRQLDVVSNGTVSLVWRPVEGDLQTATTAMWRWRVTEGVPPTDLTQKGGDDRNLALYFVFVDEESARRLTGGNARQLLRNPNTRALIYVWGGNHSPGAILQSPYHSGLRTKVLRTGTDGTFSESVDLAADYRRAFGDAPGVLVGLGVSADSDDTDTTVRASIADLQLN
ncbi:MAG: DUF3047 domain-containing protein [Pseudomonadota bacterium]